MKILEIYETTGSWPTAVTYGGITINSATWVVIDVPPIKSLYFNVIDNRLRILSALTGLAGIPGYVEPVAAHTALDLPLEL